MRIHGPFIQLLDGQYLNLVDPDYSKVTMGVLARALSNICRFSGHTGQFYSVAEHCALASMMVEQQFAWDTLLHDLSEAALGDVTAPLKALLPEYRLLEKLHCERLAQVFQTQYPLRPAVKLADLRMLATERVQLMHPENRDWPMLDGVEPFDIQIRCYSPPRAYNFFMERYEEIQMLLL